jgi:hypothetical protein
MKITYTRPPLAPYQTAIIDAPERYTVTAASTKAGKGRCSRLYRGPDWGNAAMNGKQLGGSSRRVGLQREGYCAKLRLAAVFFLLIFS